MITIRCDVYVPGCPCRGLIMSVQWCGNERHMCEWHRELMQDVAERALQGGHIDIDEMARQKMLLDTRRLGA